jgi:hypothetical protein
LGRAVDLWLHALDSIPLSGGAVGGDRMKSEARKDHR